MKRLLALVLALVFLGSCAAIAEEEKEGFFKEIEPWCFEWFSEKSQVENSKKEYKQLETTGDFYTLIPNRTFLKFETEILGLPMSVEYTFDEEEQVLTQILVDLIVPRDETVAVDKAVYEGILAELRKNCGEPKSERVPSYGGYQANFSSEYADIGILASYSEMGDKLYFRGLQFQFTP